MNKLLLIDNYDSFTYNLYDYFLQLGNQCEVIRNDKITAEDLENSDYDGWILSPGPGKPEEVKILSQAIAISCQKKIPLLGICLGHQAIGAYFNARVVKAPEPKHGKTDWAWHQKHPLFDGIESPFQVMRYHSLIVESEQLKGLEVIAHNEEGQIMAMAHPNFPLVGVQFHPESIGCPDGLHILKNWQNSYLPHTSSMT